MVLMAAAQPAEVVPQDVPVRGNRNVVTQPHHVLQHAVATRGQDRVVNARIDFAENRTIGNPQPALVDDPVTGGQRGRVACLRDIVHATLCRQACRKTLEHSAHVENRSDPLQVDTADAVAAVRDIVEQALRRQAVQGRAHRRARHLQRGRQRLLIELLIGQETAVQKRRTQLRGHCLRQREGNHGRRRFSHQTGAAARRNRIQRD